MAQPFKVRGPAEAVRAEIQSDGGFRDALIGVSTGLPPSSCGAGGQLSAAPVGSAQGLTSHFGSPLALAPWAMHGRDHLRDSFRYRSLASPKVRHMGAASVNRMPRVGLSRLRANSRGATRTPSAPANSPGFWFNPGRQALGEAVARNRVCDAAVQMIDATVIRAHHCTAGGKGAPFATRSAARARPSLPSRQLKRTSRDV